MHFAVQEFDGEYAPWKTGRKECDGGNHPEVAGGTETQGSRNSWAQAAGKAT